MDRKIDIAKKTTNTKRKATSEITRCYYPGCNENSINSHLLQKNGILSSIAPERHLYQQCINMFKTPSIYFKRLGIDKAFSFNCFCNIHDTDLFYEIENNNIDFNDYRHQVLLSLKTLLNEKNKKRINIRQNDLLIKDSDDNDFISHLADWNEQEKLGLKDIEYLENLVWKDLNTNSQSFAFYLKELDFKEVCLSSYFTYETTNELEDYNSQNGYQMDRLTDVFVNLFPYQGNSIFMIGYEKSKEEIVKGYALSFIKESIERLERRITNLLLFHCETWVCSEKFFNNKIVPVETIFPLIENFKFQNRNERKSFDLNIFRDSFNKKMQQ